MIYKLIVTTDKTNTSARFPWCATAQVVDDRGNMLATASRCQRTQATAAMLATEAAIKEAIK